jgi:hypothetical protein
MDREGNATIGDELANLERMFPVKSGLRIRARGEALHRSARAATLYAYLESEDDGKHYAIQQTVFVKKERKTAVWWSKYFAGRVFKGWKRGGTSVQRDGIMDGGIIPKINIETHQIWRLRAVIGYHLHDSFSAVSASLRPRRHQTKRPRR